MTTTLAVDTSTVVAAAIAVDGRIVASATVDDTRAHAEELMPLVQRVVLDAGLTLADLDRIVAGVGPGPFTGLRVGVVTATTLGEVLDIPVRGACSLDAIAAAWAATDAPEEFLVVSDARRKEVYWARYDGTGRRVSGPEVSAPDALPELPLAGPGAHLVPSTGSGDPSTGSGSRFAGPVDLDAGWLAAVDLPDAGLEPLYLRRPDAEVPTKAKSALGSPRLALGRLGRRPAADQTHSSEGVPHASGPISVRNPLHGVGLVREGGGPSVREGGPEQPNQGAQG